MLSRIIIGLVLVCALYRGHGQILNGDSYRSIRLKDSVGVMVYASAENSKSYYYLPQSLQLSLRQNRPEISLVLYRQHEGGPVSGGLLHLLLSWDLNGEQEKELEHILKTEVDSSAVLAGAASMELTEDPELKIISTDPVADILRRSLTSRALAPSSAGQKTALAFKFSGSDAPVVYEAFSKHERLKGIKFQFHYRYPVARLQNGVRTVVNVDAMAEGTLDQWAKWAAPKAN